MRKYTRIYGLKIFRERSLTGLKRRALPVASVRPFSVAVAATIASPARMPDSGHVFKYRLALVVDGRCVLRYDNEPGKGDHRHFGKKEHPYVFSTPQRLLDDFWSEVDKWRF